MKKPLILIDSCVSPTVGLELKNAGFDVEMVVDWGGDPDDEAILDYAIRKKKVLVTLDRGFGERAFIQHIKHHGILRIVEAPTSQHAAIAIAVLNRYSDDLSSGAIINADLKRVRIRRRF